MQQMWSASASECSSRFMSNSLYPRALKDAFCKKNPQFSGFKWDSCALMQDCYALCVHVCHCSQHDSQEFMQFLLSSLHEELKKPLRNKPNIPQDEEWVPSIYNVLFCDCAPSIYMYIWTGIYMYIHLYGLLLHKLWSQPAYWGSSVVAHTHLEHMMSCVQTPPPLITILVCCVTSFF